MVIGVGERARTLVRAAIEAGIPEEQTRTFATSVEAAAALVELVQKGDVLLVKGSQSIRTEHIVEVLLADAADGHFLVRQDAEWKKR